METNKDDKMLLAGAEDKFRQCSEQYRITYTNFLDLRQRSLIERRWKEMSREDKGVRLVFYGGYEDAERTVAAFLPDNPGGEACPFSV